VRKYLVVSAFLLALGAEGEEGPSEHRVSRAEILEAMQREKGYDLTATTNEARFQGAVLLTVARSAARRRPDGPPLLIHHEDWYRAYLEVAGLEEAQAPIFARLAFEHGQETFVDYRMERVIANVAGARHPQVALNVRFCWPDVAGAPSHYSYDDLLSVPRLRVTYRQEIRYRLLQVGGLMVYDEIDGLSGRPTSGLLGLLFRVIGEGRITFSRIAVSRDGVQVVYAGARKGPFSVTSTVTVQPGGVATKNLPPDRPDLQPIEASLRRPLGFDYVPWK
jgi:hypothetical protein